MYKKILTGLLVLGMLGIAGYGIGAPAGRGKKVPTTATGSATSPTTTAPIHMAKGWNLVSMPCTYSALGIISWDEFDSLFPRPPASSFAFGMFFNRTGDDEWCNYLDCATCTPRYSTGYATAWPDPGEGFWIKYDSATDVNIPCAWLNESMQIPVWTTITDKGYSAWNLIGGITYDVPLANVTTSDPDMLDSRFFGYNGGYFEADTIEAGKGYWIKIKKCGKIILQKPALSKTTIGFAVMGFTPTNKTGLNVLNLWDQKTAAHPRKLYFGIPVAPIAENQTTIPPAITGDFDARFTDKGGKDIQPFTAVPPAGIYYDIAITEWSTPLTIAWQMNQTNYISTLSYVSGGSQKNINLTGLSQITISDTSIVSFTLKITPKPTAPPPRTCFLAGTPITMANGSTRAIEQLKVGDTVLAYDEATGSLKPDKVKEFFEHEADEYLVVNGRLKLTSNHPVNSGGKWVEIGKLKKGDSLLNAQGKEEKIASIEKVNEKVKVYNLEVNPYHTYIAGGIVVHNKLAPSPTSTAN